MPAEEGPSTALAVEDVNRNVLRSFSKAVIPIIGVILLIMFIGTVAVMAFVGAPFKRDTPPKLPDDAFPEFRLYHHNQREMQSLSIQAANKVLAVSVLQVGAGLILGFLCVFLGSVMCWFGVTGAVSMEASGANTKFNLQSAQIGVILLLGGVLLVSLSIIKNNSPGGRIDGPGDTSGTSVGNIPIPGTGASPGGLFPSSPYRDAPPINEEERKRREGMKNNLPGVRIFGPGEGSTGDARPARHYVPMLIS